MGEDGIVARRDHLDNEGFEGWEGGADDSEVGFEGCEEPDVEADGSEVFGLVGEDCLQDRRKGAR